MPTIDVDPDVQQELTSRCAREAKSYSELIGALLALVPQEKARGAWVHQGVEWPSGTRFRASTEAHYAEVNGGAFYLNGERQGSLAKAIRKIKQGKTANTWQ
jgi:hypothetical protein